MENALRLKVGINLHYKYKSLNPYFFGKCSTAIQLMAQSKFCANVLILIFLENALRQILSLGLDDFNVVLILIFLENALRLKVGINLHYKYKSLNPYFFGKCSTARAEQNKSNN